MSVETSKLSDLNAGDEVIVVYRSKYSEDLCYELETVTGLIGDKLVSVVGRMFLISTGNDISFDYCDDLMRLEKINESHYELIEQTKQSKMKQLLQGKEVDSLGLVPTNFVGTQFYGTQFYIRPESMVIFSTPSKTPNMFNRVAKWIKRL